MIEKITAFFVSLILSVMALFTPEVPKPVNIENSTELLDLFNQHELSDEVYVIDAGVLNTADKMHVAICLQGIVAKDKPSIYIKTNSADNYYLDEIKKSGINLIYTDENSDKWTLERLILKFKHYITDSGYVLYRPSDTAEGLNMATNLATLYGYLAVPDTLEELAINAGLVLKEDFSDDKYNAMFQWRIFNEYKDSFNFKAVVHEHYDMKGLRDLAIQQGFFTFYVDDDKDGTWFRKLVLKHAGDNSFVLGWAKYEVRYVTEASENGNSVIPSDHCYNNSILASFNCELPPQKHNETKSYHDENKHYCALVFSDGDNIQWIQNGFSEYYQKLSLKTDFPMTWTFPPILQKISPVSYKRIIDSSTINDYFIAGVSGIGYMHPSEYPYKSLADFTDITAYSMSQSEQEYVSILDSVPENFIEEARLTESLKHYSRYDNIKGGILYLDPSRYMGGEGKVYFVDNKPFVSTRLSLWHPTNDKDSVTHEWLSEQADLVNSFEHDIYSTKGYSVVNVHPWSITLENLEYFVNLLDEDVVLVTVDELLEMMRVNVPHSDYEVM